MRLFYDQGKPYVTMSLEEFTENIRLAGAVNAPTTTGAVNGSKARSAGVGRKPVARVVKRRRVVPKRPVKGMVRARRRKRDEAAITRKRIATMARNREVKAAESLASTPQMAASQ